MANKYTWKDTHLDVFSSVLLKYLFALLSRTAFLIFNGVPLTFDRPKIYRFRLFWYCYTDDFSIDWFYFTPAQLHEELMDTK